MANDRELLEAAAKASGLPLEWGGPHDTQGKLYYKDHLYRTWNPLTDDGDAFRLAVMCRITPHIDGNLTEAASTAGFFSEPHLDDPFAATRRAIVRAAAAMATTDASDQV